MKSAPFDYRRPTSLAEALRELASAGDEGKALAGGQSLIPLLAMRLARPALLVDLDRVAELDHVTLDGRSLRIGAMTRHRTVEDHAHLPPAMREAVRHVGHFQIRNRGTVGGSLAHADPAAEWPALAVAFDAELVLESAARGRRRVAAKDFFLGPLMTAVEPDELLVEVVIPDASGPAAFTEVERRAGDFALVGAAAHAGRVVVFGAGSRPQRLGGVEAAARSGAGPEDVETAARAEIEAVDDIHASAAYRRTVGARLVVEVLRSTA